MKISLDQVLEFRNLPAKPVRLAIMQQLSKAVDAASLSGTLSGDLAPQNVSVAGDLNRPEITVTLTGTGSVFVPEEELTTDGTIPEAAFYLPPERILGTSTDLRSYEFSLGVIAYEFVCGRKPFEAANLSQLFYRVCSDKPVPAGEVDRTLTPRVSAVINRALSQDPEQRYSDCTTFINALTAALLGCPGWSGTTYESKPPQVSRIPAAGAYGVSSTRISRRYEDRAEDDGLASARSQSSRRYALIAALCLAAAGLGIFIARYKPAPNLPVQVLDTKAGPATPPPDNTPVSPPDATAHTEPATPAPLSNPTRTEHNNPPAAPKRDAPATGIADVGFLTNPPSAEIIVDSDRAKSCASPCTLSLPPGRHTLSASLSGFDRAQRIFSPPQDKSLFIALNRQMGTLVVTSTPSGLAILVDGKNYGQTPATLHLAPGEHRLLIINGVSQHGETVYVQADAIQAKAINW